MKTTEELILKVYDIETIYEEFSITVSDPGYKNPIHFRINRFTNQLDALCKYLTSEEVDYWVGFNNVNFDAQVLTYMIENQSKWFDLNGSEVIARISQFASDVIDDTNAGLFPPYRESRLWAPQIDLFKIHHFDNENRRTSLKWLEFTMGMDDIEEMPISHMETQWIGNREIPKDRLFEQKDFDLIDHYRINDVKSTCKFLDYTLGNVESEQYKGKNKIQDRLDTIDEFKLPPEAINWSDVKIGDELNKLGYMQLKGIKDPKKLYELKRNAKRKTKFTFGDCIPNYVHFRSAEFIAFYDRMAKEPVKLVKNKKKGKKEATYHFTYNGTNYTIAQGGIHSNEKNRLIEPQDNEVLMDADIGSQYPNAIYKRKLYPSHLGPEWLTMYGNTIKRRIGYKKRGKDDKRAKGIAEMLKLSLNGGGFGKLNENTNWQYDPFAAFQCTIGNQFEILMLIEDLEIEGIHVVSANTDGIVCLFDKSRLEDYYRICHAWEAKVGNTDMGQLEYQRYALMVQSSVNDYLAVKIGKDGADGEADWENPKLKGDFVIDMELNKNPSRRILPIVYRDYFTKKITPEETINNHKEILDFCVGLKASRNYHYEAIDPKTNEKSEYRRIIRYFISNEGKNLLKIKNEGSEADGPEISACEARGYGYWWTTEMNTKDDSLLPTVNKKYYLENAWEFIRDVERGKKKGAKKVTYNPNQINLF